MTDDRIVAEVMRQLEPFRHAFDRKAPGLFRTHSGGWLKAADVEVAVIQAVEMARAQQPQEAPRHG